MSGRKFVMQFNTKKGTDIVLSEKFINFLRERGTRSRASTTLEDESGARLDCIVDPTTYEIIGVGTLIKKYKPTTEHATIIEVDEQDLRGIPWRVTFDESVKAQEPENGAWDKSSRSVPFTPNDLPIGLVAAQDPFKRSLMPTGENAYLPIKNLTTHVFVCGATGSGKTVFAKSLVEQAALRGVPSIVIDFKGDLSALALVFPKARPEDFLPWVDGASQEERHNNAIKASREFKTGTSKFGISEEEIHLYQDKVSVNVFTPLSDKGFRLAFSPFENPPDNYSELIRSEEDVVVQMIETTAAGIVDRFPVTKKQKNNWKSLIIELIGHCWENGKRLKGLKGIEELIRLVKNPPIERVGAVLVEDFINEKERNSLANHINNLLVGASKLWFKGIPFDLDVLLLKGGCDNRGKTPITVINVMEMDSFEDRCFVISKICYAIWAWLRKRSGSAERPQIVFYIDEIGSSTGRTAFYPSVGNPPSKPGLQILLRQGRSLGLSCIFATQNPGDVDYKGLSNCHTWIVGKLATERDRKKIQQGAAAADIEFREVYEKLIGMLPASFLVRKPPEGDWECFKERWLYSYHPGKLSYAQIARIKKDYDSKATSILEKADELLRNKEFRRARDEVSSLLRDFPFYSEREKARILKGRCEIECGEVDEAINDFEDITENSYEEGLVQEAWYYMGHCYRAKERFDKAKDCFQQASVHAADEDLTVKANNWRELCTLRFEIPQVGLWEKFKIWLFGREYPIPRVILADEARGELSEEDIPRSDITDQMLNIPPSISLEEIQTLLKEEIDYEKREAELHEKTGLDLQKANEQLTRGDLLAAKDCLDKIARSYKNAGVFRSKELQGTIEKYNDYRSERIDGFKRYLQEMAPLTFEYEIATLFNRMGYEARATRASGDQGVDVWAKQGNVLFAIQCKKWKDSVGPKEVRELHGSRPSPSCRAIFVTTSTFTNGAVECATEKDIQLIDGDELLNLLMRHPPGCS
jgi:tetratricopeptide (TPR) repeat protein